MQISSQRLQGPAAAQATAPSRSTQQVQASATRVGTAGQPPLQGPPPAHASGSAMPTSTTENLARLDSFMESAMERLKNAAANAPDGEVTSFREAAATLEQSFGRLRAGLTDGTLEPTDVQRGVRNTFDMVRGVLESARPTGSDGMSAGAAAAVEAGPPMAGPGPEASAPPTDAAAMARGRYSNLTERVMDRFEGLEFANEESAMAAQDAMDAFESAAARLDQALFNPVSGDPIDRGTFRSLYEDALSALQTQLTDLMGGMAEGGNAILYTAQSEAVGLGMTRPGVDVAG